MKLFIIIIIVLMGNHLFAQESIDLKTCYILAEENYPLKSQIGLFNKITNRELDNLTAKYYPQINLIGQVTYQSDVIKLDMDIQIPNVNIDFPEIDKDQYKAGITVDQMIWDGGIVSNQKDIAVIQGHYNKQNVSVELYQLRHRINTSFFAILKLQENIKILILALEDMNAKLTQIHSAVNNGVLLQSNANIMKAEILKTEQRLSELENSKHSALEMLSTLIEKDLKNTELKPPEVNFEKNDGKERPEFKLFDISQNKLDEIRNLADAKYLPKVYAFGQAMYGKPGLNMFDPDFQPFYILGIKASWNFWDWSISNREKEIVTLQKEIVKSNESTFEKNLRIGSDALYNEVGKIIELLEKDKEIIELRLSIVKTVSSQLENGTITSSEYLTEFNALTRAELSYQLHLIELKEAQIVYLTQVGAEL